MEKPVSLVARDAELSEKQRQEIETRARKLERFYPRLVGCAVHVDGPGAHHKKGGSYSVRLDLRIPGRDPMIVNRQAADDLDVAIGVAFDTAERRLNELAARRRS